MKTGEVFGNQRSVVVRIPPLRQILNTQLVIFPVQFHGPTISSYQRDRLWRYLAWFDKDVKPNTP